MNSRPPLVRALLRREAYPHPVTRVDVVWAWGDLMNALQIFPNVIGLIGLSAIAAKYAANRGHRAE